MLHVQQIMTAAIPADESLQIKSIPERGLNQGPLIQKADTLQPIFHQNAKYLASGAGVGQCPRRQTFALGIPTCWYLKCENLCYRRQTPDAKPEICVSPNTKPLRQSVEYRLRWVPGIGSLRWACTFHIFCVDFICVG